MDGGMAFPSDNNKWDGKADGTRNGRDWKKNLVIIVLFIGSKYNLFSDNNAIDASKKMISYSCIWRNTVNLFI